MGVKFNPVKEVRNTTLASKIGMTIQQGLGQIFLTKTSNYGVGVTVENTRFAKLEEHFKNVPDFEYNKLQSNLKIEGELMGTAGVDY